jgi:hypothetical protein
MGCQREPAWEPTAYGKAGASWPLLAADRSARSVEAEAAQAEYVRDFGPRGEPALGGFRAHPRDHGRRDVDAGDIGASAPRAAASSAFSPVSQPESRSRPVMRPWSASRTRAGCGLPMSHGGRRADCVAGVPPWVCSFRHKSVPPQDRRPRIQRLAPRQADPGGAAEDT